MLRLPLLGPRSPGQPDASPSLGVGVPVRTPAVGDGSPSPGGSRASELWVLRCRLEKGPWTSRGRSCGHSLVTACLVGLAACARGEERSAWWPTNELGFCVGVDAAHPADGRATVTFKRGDEVLGEMISNVVTGSVSMPVTPGEVTVYVDGAEVVSLGVLAGVHGLLQQRNRLPRDPVTLRTPAAPRCPSVAPGAPCIASFSVARPARQPSRGRRTWTTNTAGSVGTRPTGSGPGRCACELRGHSRPCHPG